VVVYTAWAMISSAARERQLAVAPRVDAAPAS
jgi:hypothetical protein